MWGAYVEWDHDDPDGSLTRALHKLALDGRPRVLVDKAGRVAGAVYLRLDVGIGLVPEMVVMRWAHPSLGPVFRPAL